MNDGPTTIAEHIPPALEAILLVAEDPLPPELLAQLVGASTAEVEQACVARLGLRETPRDEDVGRRQVAV